MKSFFSVLVFILVAALNTPAWGYDVQIEGILVSYDQKRIKLRQENGKDIYIPRSSIGSLDGYVTGKATLKTSVRVKDILAANTKAKR